MSGDGLTGYFQRHVFCCTNKRPDGHRRGSCIDRGGGELREYLKQRCKAEGVAGTRINASGCLDRCELGPVMVIYPEGVWYRPLSREDIDEILLEHLQGGRIVERLVLRNDQAD